jgi:hypothetical protein
MVFGVVAAAGVAVVALLTGSCPSEANNAIRVIPCAAVSLAPVTVRARRCELLRVPAGLVPHRPSDV